MGKTKELPQVDKNVTQKKEERGFYVELGFKFMALTNRATQLMKNKSQSSPPRG